MLIGCLLSELQVDGFFDFLGLLVLVVIVFVKVKEVIFVIKLVLVPYSIPAWYLLTCPSGLSLKGAGGVTCCFFIHFYFRNYNMSRYIISIKIIVHSSKSGLWFMILLQVKLLHLKDLFVEIIFGGSVSLQMLKSLHKSLCKRRNLPFWEVVKELLNIRWEPDCRLPINS